MTRYCVYSNQANYSIVKENNVLGKSAKKLTFCVKDLKIDSGAWAGAI